MIREFKPSVCLELGTCLGISAAYQATALKLNQRGEVFTLEGAQSLAFIAKENLAALGLENIRVIDGNHDEKATLEHFEQISLFLSERAVLIFDDISWSKGMKTAWGLVEKDQRVGIAIDLDSIGVCVISSSTKMRKFKIFMVSVLCAGFCDSNNKEVRS